MKTLSKVLALSLMLTACGDNGSSDGDENKAPDPTVQKPTPMKVEESMKQGFTKECEAANKGTPLGEIYGGIIASSDAKDCASAFDAIAKKREVRVGQRDFNSLAPLAHIPFVERLYVYGPIDKETDALKTLTNLQSVHLNEAGVSDVSFLKQFKHLKSVIIGHTPVKSVLPLVDIATLEIVTIEYPQDASGATVLPKDEAHCPVKSKNKAVNEACSYYRAIAK